MKNFNKRLKALRSEKKLTQEDVARRLNIQRATYSGYERGIIMPPYEKINALAHYFNVTVEYLMGDDEKTDNLDARKILTDLINELRQSNRPLMFGETELDRGLRGLLKSSLEANVEMIDFVIKKGG